MTKARVEQQFAVVVVCAEHTGTEAAVAAAGLGVRIGVVLSALKTISQRTCNPRSAGSRVETLEGRTFCAQVSIDYTVLERRDSELAVFEYRWLSFGSVRGCPRIQSVASYLAGSRSPAVRPMNSSARTSLNLQ